MTYKQHLNGLRKLIFDTAFDPEYDDCFTTINQLADAAGLSWVTVDNLYRGKTKYPRYETIYKIAIAVGFRPELVRQEMESYAG